MNVQRRHGLVSYVVLRKGRRRAGMLEITCYQAVGSMLSITGAPKLINSDLFLEKRATVPMLL